MKKIGYLLIVAAMLCLIGCSYADQNMTEATNENTVPSQIEESVPSTENTTPTEPTLQTEPTEPSQPTEQTVPTESTQPVEQPETQPTEPAKPTEPTEPEEPTTPTEPEKTPEKPEKESASGWQERDGKRYYYLEDGQPATGKTEIDGRTYYFSSQGEEILLANPWNYIHEDYSPDLVELSLSVSVEGSRVDRSCYDALNKMIKDCNKECPEVCVVSSYRTMEHQTRNFNRKVQKYLDKGYSQEDAERLAATVIAVPGTSEHQLGLAVDIVDTRLWSLVEEQADLPGQKWLMENCWKYGFILRYPADKTDVTGIIYEPWHYRYVGKAVAKELHESGQTLEEYLDALT